MTIGEKIKCLRKSKQMSQEELARKLNTTKQAIYKYENNLVTNIPVEKIEILSEIFQVSPSYLTGWDRPTIYDIAHTAKNDTTDPDLPFTSYTIPQPKKGVRIPVYGSVAAGIPIEAITDIEDYEEIQEDMARTGEFAALKIKGDSMEPKFSSGDVVIVRLQDDVDNGDIAIVLVNGDEATCKKIKKTPEGVMLISTNPNYEPMFYSNREIAELPVRIWGKVVELRAKF